MAQDRMTLRVGHERMREQAAEGLSPGEWLLEGIADTLRESGTPLQRVCCCVLMAALTGAQLPGGGYACQAAMFAVLLRLGFCVPAAFAGVAGGFVISYAQRSLLACWQLPVCVALWLTSGLWARRESRLVLAAVVAGALLSAAAVMGAMTPYTLAVLLMTATAGGALSVLYMGAALSVCRRDELDGETRPLCVMAVCASLIGGLSHLPGGHAVICALALYLTLEHAYAGGAQQALLCAGVLGSVTSLCVGDVQVLAMLLCGGFLSGEVKVSRRWLCALLMLLGMAAAAALLGGEMERLRLLVFCMPGMLPFLVLPPGRRRAVTALVEHTAQEEMSQSGAVAVRCAALIHAWAGLYRDTARMMEGICGQQAGGEMAQQCIDLLKKTSAAAHQVCERTLAEIRADDEAFRRIRYELMHAGLDEVQPVYALEVGGRLEALLLKPEAMSSASLQGLVTRCCGVDMRASPREDLLCTQALFEQAPPLDMEIGAAVRSCSGEEVAGDSYVSRSLPGGLHILALSDGMGSGVSALKESHACLHLMVESLRAGYTRAQALDVVNQLMLMCTGREMYATMDLCVCDLHTGEAAFEKLGACASYLIRDGEVRSIGAETLPVGVLQDVEAQSLRLTLCENDVIVMLTDGVAEAFPGGEDALREALSRLSWLHPRAVGERLIEETLADGQARDDMAVLCARVRRSAFC